MLKYILGLAGLFSVVIAFLFYQNYTLRSQIDQNKASQATQENLSELVDGMRISELTSKIKNAETQEDVARISLENLEKLGDSIEVNFYQNVLN